MEKFKSKSLGMDIVVRDYTETNSKCCGNCYYWDDRTTWCDELESYGDADSTWTCERWVDKNVYGN